LHYSCHQSQNDKRFCGLQCITYRMAQALHNISAYQSPCLYCCCTMLSKHTNNMYTTCGQCCINVLGSAKSGRGEGVDVCIHRVQEYYSPGADQPMGMCDCCTLQQSKHQQANTMPHAPPWSIGSCSRVSTPLTHQLPLTLHQVPEHKISS
jgi:hypothetical protein